VYRSDVDGSHWDLASGLRKKNAKTKKAAVDDRSGPSEDALLSYTGGQIDLSA